MGLAIKVNLSVMEDRLGGPENVQEYLNSLKTKQVMFLNGPESPGPCLRCLSYHRTVWKKSDPRRPRPLLHPNCYCRVVSYRPAEGEVKPQIKGEYLRKQISKLNLRQREILMGKGIARLHRLGIVETEHLVSQSGGINTLEKLLRNKLGITQKQFNKLTDGDLVLIYEQKLK